MALTQEKKMVAKHLNQKQDKLSGKNTKTKLILEYLTLDMHKLVTPDYSRQLNLA